MPDSSSFPAEIETAFAALTRYDRGSPRGDLMPLDEAVQHALPRAPERDALETRLIAALQTEISFPAKEFVCRQLTLLGSARCVPVLASLLDDDALANVARSVLEALSVPEATAALRNALPQLTGVNLAGVATSLGVKRDTASVPRLARLQRNSEAEIATAAIVALGRIGGPEATAALQAWQEKSPARLRPLLEDALTESRAFAPPTP